jgi:hypothetical protein
MAFLYDVEFAQAIFLLLVPLSLVVWQSVRVSRRLVGSAVDPDALHRTLMRHRRVTQVIGMLSICVTALYGMWQNTSVSILH